MASGRRSSASQFEGWVGVSFGAESTGAEHENVSKPATAMTALNAENLSTSSPKQSAGQYQPTCRHRSRAEPLLGRARASDWLCQRHPTRLGPMPPTDTIHDASRPSPMISKSRGTRTIDLARPKGFEPLTGGLETRCSIRLSYERVLSRLEHRRARILPIGASLVKQCDT